MSDNIPLVDLRAQYNSIKPEIDRAIMKIIDSSAFVGCEAVKSFEEEFASFCDAKSCAAVGNGTDALFLALKALGIGIDDEVVTVSHTFVATAEAILNTGAIPVFVDIQRDTMLMDPLKLAAAINDKTKAIVPVHLYGQPCDMTEIMKVAKAKQVPVVEDGAQAHGARWNGSQVGSFGNLTCFSFYPGKNLGAYGDAGAVVGNDEELINRVKMLSNHGRRKKYVHEAVGVNSRMDGMQAAVLSVKLKHLNEWNERRSTLAAAYQAKLTDTGLELPVVDKRATPVWHLFVVRTSKREIVQSQLRKRGISTGVHYPVSLHKQPALESRFRVVGNLEETEQVANRVLSLPLFAELSDDSIDRIVESVKNALENKLTLERK